MRREWRNKALGIDSICMRLGRPERRESQLLLLSVQIPASLKRARTDSPLHPLHPATPSQVVRAFKRMARRHCAVRRWPPLGSGGGAPHHPRQLERPQARGKSKRNRPAHSRVLPQHPPGLGVRGRRCWPDGGRDRGEPRRRARQGASGGGLPGGRERGARPVGWAGEQVLEQRPRGCPATEAFDGQGRLLPGLLIRMQIQLWSSFLWRQTEGCLCVCKDEACLNKPSSIGWVSKNKPVGQTLATSSPPPNYKVWICYNSLTRRFSPLRLVSLLIKRPLRAWRQMTEAQSGGNCS